MYFSYDYMGTNVIALSFSLEDTKRLSIRELSELIGRRLRVKNPLRLFCKISPKSPQTLLCAEDQVVTVIVIGDNLSAVVAEPENKRDS